MLSLFNGLRGLELYAILFRTVAAVLCGALIGLERSYKNRPAGFRTHILVCLGACVASTTGLYLYVNQHLPTDIARIGAQVVTGLGFLGAGTIIVTKDESVKGLTTAAGLWTCGVIGLAIGAGFYEGGFLATCLVLLTETQISKITANMRHPDEFKIMIMVEDKDHVDPVMRYCKDRDMTITNLTMTNFRDVDRNIINAVISLRASHPVDKEKLIKTVSELNGILDAELL